MEIRSLKLHGLLEIVPKRHGDERGWFSEIFREDRFRKQAGAVSFVQENQSMSVQAGTVRGVHFQTHPFAQGKLVRCVAGALFDVAVDLRHDSPTYGEWVAVELSAEAGNQLWIPAGFGHGFCTLVPNTIVAYKVTAYYSPECDKGVAWNDADIAIAWPAIADPATLSVKDRTQPCLRDHPACFSLHDVYEGYTEHG